jgi:hypothetical protein
MCLILERERDHFDWCEALLSFKRIYCGGQNYTQKLCFRIQKFPLKTKSNQSIFFEYVSK